MLGVASSSRVTIGRAIAATSRHVSATGSVRVARPSVFTLQPQGRFKSTLKVVPPSDVADREVPTPLLFLTASKWTSSPAAEEAFAPWITHFAAQGFQSLLLDLDPEQDLSSITESTELMSVFEKEAIQTLRDANQNPPFPPILLTRGPAALIAQTYVSSRPLTALQLVVPPINNEYLRKEQPQLLPNTLPEFDFEATFPVRVVWSQQELDRQQKLGVPWYDVHRIEHEREEDADESLDRYTFASEEAGAKETQEWLEGEVGVYDVETTAQDDVGLFEDLEEPFEEAADEFGEEEGSAEEAKRSKAESAGQISPHEQPDWFTAGDYTLQPGSRKFPLVLDERDLTEKFVRGSGPGGQAINKLSTNVQLTHTPTGTKVTCQETRSRDRNRKLARRRMSLLLEKLVLGDTGGSRIDRDIEKQRKRKNNKKKKQKRRLREKGAETPESDEAEIRLSSSSS